MTVYLVLAIIILIGITILLVSILIKNIDNKNQEISSLNKKIKKYKKIFPLLNNEEHLYDQKIDFFKRKGIIGEALVEKRLESIAEKYSLILFNDLYLAWNKYVVQVDHILIAKNCVFIIETKNWSMNTYGDIISDEWYQFYGSEKEFINSPIKQNYHHLKLVLSILRNNKDINLNDLSFYNLVVFVQDNLALTNDFYSKNNIYFKGLNFYELNSYIDGVLKEKNLLSKDYSTNISISLLKANQFKNIALHAKKLEY